MSSRRTESSRKGAKAQRMALMGVMLFFYCGNVFAAAEVSAAQVIWDDVVRYGELLRELFLSGGAMMWPVLLVGLAGGRAALERSLNLRAIKHAPSNFEKDVVHFVDLRGVDAGLTLCKEKASSLSRVLTAALLRHGASRADMEAAALEECRRVRHDLRRNTRTVGMAAMLAPACGLLGASTQLYALLERATVLNAPLVPGLPGVVLPFTFGLLVAVPMLFMYVVLLGKADDIVRMVEDQAIDAVVTLDRKARQSIRLIEDLEEHIETKHMPGLKSADLAGEFDSPARDESQLRTSITTRHAGLPAVEK